VAQISPLSCTRTTRNTVTSFEKRTYKCTEPCDGGISRPRSEPGKHDDCVDALALGLIGQVLDRMSAGRKPPPETPLLGMHSMTLDQLSSCSPGGARTREFEL
jgi:hypothetical protein